MKTAVNNGVNFFDTANVYGAGRSKGLIGRFLKECDSPVVVAPSSAEVMASILTTTQKTFYFNPLKLH